jgi:hypothetical protein
MRRLSWLFALLLLVVGLLAPASPAAAASNERVTARLGISAGSVIQDLPLGTTGFALHRRIPELFRSAVRLGIRIETVSVGRGFFADNGQLSAENDLDLVVYGPRDNIITLAAILGKEWDQSVVFVWFPRPGGAQATAAIPLPGGANLLTDAIYTQLLVELFDGGHVRYFGRDSLLFVANVGGEPEASFAARMQRVLEILRRNNVPVGRIQNERADFTAVGSDQYDEIIDNACRRPWLPTCKRDLEPAA